MATAARGPRLSLDALYRPIADDLARAEAILARELRSSVSFVNDLTARVQLYRGKRLRPAMLLLTAQACGGIRPAHHTLAAVVEMIHAATLVHDDVLDESDKRRHVTTVNATWGTEASVLLGDFLFTHSFHLAASLESTLACRLIGRATNAVCEGELHQIATRGRFDLPEDEYIEIVAGKTAELLACCGQLGAHFADADPGVEEAMASYGRYLGIAFQIADDLLDLTGETANIGKPIGADLSKQKLTLPLIRYRDTAPAIDVEEMRRMFVQANGRDQRARIMEKLHATDAVSYSESRAREFAVLAESQLAALPISPARDLLVAISRFVVDRSN